MVSQKRLYLTAQANDPEARVVHEGDEKARYLLVGANCDLSGEYAKFTQEVQLLNEEAATSLNSPAGAEGAPATDTDPKKDK